MSRPRYLANSPFKAPDPPPPVEVFAVNDQVTHDKYGLGIVLGTEAEAVLVDFGQRRIRVTSPYAKMTKL